MLKVRVLQEFFRDSYAFHFWINCFQAKPLYYYLYLKLWSSSSLPFSSLFNDALVIAVSSCSLAMLLGRLFRYLSL